MKSFKFILNIIASLILVNIAIFDIIGFSTPDVEHFQSINPDITAMMKHRQVQMAAKGRLYAPRIDWISLNEIPRAFQKAILYNEDTRFYLHNGVDWYEFFYAVEDMAESGEKPRGASTITMQLAKNLFLNPQRSFLRKVKEFWIAKALEKYLGKQRILELYLNVAEWGPEIFGCQAASKFWYSKSVDELSLREIASLAVILPAPLRFSPTNPDQNISDKINKTVKYLTRRGFMDKTRAHLARPLDKDSSSTQVSIQLQQARKNIDLLSPDSLIPF